MATARIEEILPEPPPKKVILELSEYEASVLKRILFNVGGDRSGPRRAADDINVALGIAGISHEGVPCPTGGIYF